MKGGECPNAGSEELGEASLSVLGEYLQFPISGQSRLLVAEGRLARWEKLRREYHGLLQEAVANIR